MISKWQKENSNPFLPALSSAVCSPVCCLPSWLTLREKVDTQTASWSPIILLLNIYMNIHSVCVDLFIGAKQRDWGLIYRIWMQEIQRCKGENEQKIGLPFVLSFILQVSQASWWHVSPLHHLSGFVESLSFPWVHGPWEARAKMEHAQARRPCSPLFPRL